MSTYIDSWIYALKNTTDRGPEGDTFLARLIDQRDNEGLVRMSFTLGAAMPEGLQAKLDEHTLMQGMFDVVCRHIKTQKSQANVGEGSSQTCAYRTDDGRSCAIGCLLDDADIEKIQGFNTLPVESLHDLKRLPPHLMVVPVAFLGRLQRSHDQPLGAHGTFVIDALAMLVKVAAEYDLDPRETIQ